MVENNEHKDSKILIGVVGFLGLTVAILVVVNLFLFLSRKGSWLNPDEDLAADCVSIEDNVAAKECIDNLSFTYFYEQNDCNKALEVYDDIPEGRFDEDWLSVIYSDAYSMSLSCEDMAVRQYWKEKYNVILSQLEDIE